MSNLANLSKIKNTDGDVVHLRMPTDLKQGLQTVAKIKGRDLTRHILLILDEHLYGPREYRLANGTLGEN